MRSIPTMQKQGCSCSVIRITRWAGCFTRQELQEMAEICLQNEAIIVSDEIHSELLFDGSRHIPDRNIVTGNCR